MANFFLTNKAVEDLTNIWNYTVNSLSENQAEIYYNLLMDTCQELAENLYLANLSISSKKTF